MNSAASVGKDLMAGDVTAALNTAGETADKTGDLGVTVKDDLTLGVNRTLQGENPWVDSPEMLKDAEHCLNNISAEVEERIKEKYRKVETMCLSDLEKKFNPIVSSSRLHGVVLYLSNECEKH